ncbi:DUF5132 domain-containing protein [Henriciella aquimarina]|uniref:DUF5132 domain-containing protein n=1 Tax=Henriciella aquimarina TaxID=545261 RepID=UPI000A0287CE|nr:DUF5132 domain-containing protein [Henriciella aquimarina]
MGAFSRLAGLGFLVGAGVVTAGAVVVAPRVMRAARPHLREGLKLGLSGYDLMRRAAAEAMDDFEDLVAEARAEMRPRQAAPPQPDGDATQAPSAPETPHTSPEEKLG